MLILLPPSEGKTPARRGRPLDLADLSFPALRPARQRVLDALVDLCGGDPERARVALGLPPGLADLVGRNAGLTVAATARADRVYSGVLYDALGLPDLPAEARRRAATRVAVVSSLFGLVRPGDRIPAYRLSGDTSLPGLGPVAGVWRTSLGEVVREAVGGGLLVDLQVDDVRRVLAARSPTWRAGWSPCGCCTRPTDGERWSATSTRRPRAGWCATCSPTAPTPARCAALAAALTRLGWRVEVGAPGRAGTPLDVVVSQVQTVRERAVTPLRGSA